MAPRDPPAALTGAAGPAWARRATSRLRCCAACWSTPTEVRSSWCAAASAATAWSLRFILKRRAVVTKVGPLEGLWWTSDGLTDLDTIFGDERETWRWTLFIALPDEAAPAEIDGALAAGRAKLEEPFASSLRVEPFTEGRVAQLLHLGPYAAERPSIERLHVAIAGAGLRPIGRHHEIYLGIPGRSDPARLKTILRQPVT